MEICDLGQRPPLGEVPENMHAMVIRQDRFGEPETSFQREGIPTPELGPLDVLVYVMATGINYNNVWAALGEPLDVIAERQRKGESEDFHAGGSDCSGIVWKVGESVTDCKPGDEVVVHSGWWQPDDPWVLSGRDPMLAESTRIWGYQTNYGSFCQFARVQSHQCQPKPARLTWEEAGCYMLCASTAYRMLMGWSPNTVEPDDVVLVWGAARRAREHRSPDRPERRRTCGGSRFLRRQAAVLSRPWSHWSDRPKRLLTLGCDAGYRGARVRAVGEGRARVWEGDLGGDRRPREPTDRLRASR